MRSMLKASETLLKSEVGDGAAKEDAEAAKKDAREVKIIASNRTVPENIDEEDRN